MSPFDRPSASFRDGRGPVKPLSLDREKARELIAEVGYGTKRERCMSILE